MGVSLPGNGCEVHNDCLTCPLEQCIFDNSALADRYGRVGRRHRMVEQAVQVKQLRREGTKITTIAALLGKSRRTVYRLQRLQTA